ncbi:porphobilinogen synthase [Saccharicrinis sp. FJH2]|uniref:porphobilinogen synthase n=1 Tax=unclassified Saccharicrinis TaxID=2646859 RepID=UPI0035D40280
MAFPVTRLRRLRKTPVIRDLVRETKLTRDDLIMPLFVRYGKNVKNEIASMPGNYQMSVDVLTERCKELYDKGVKSVLLFGIPEHKDETGEVACHDHGIVQQAVHSIKKAVPDLYVVADICNCEYTTHGHCGTLIDGDVDNDFTLVTLAKQSVSLVKAGVDMVAPSDMMDGRVKAIREALDAANFQNTPIMSYSVKFASAYYGPFRDAAESAPKFGDRKTYQMDPANRMEALREAEQDVIEGADILMVKPALSYLDIIRDVKNNFNLPLAAYNVSGEFSMVKAAAANGWIDEEKLTMEMLTSIKRAGADIIISYFTQDIIEKL